MTMKSALEIPLPGSRHAAYRPGLVVRGTVRAAALVAVAAASYLAWVSIQAGDAAGGCAGLPQFDCEHVLANPRWSTWLGLSVSLPAVGVYLAVFAASWLIGPKCRPRTKQVAWAALALLVPMAAGAGLWFVALMALVIHKLCLYCLLTHTCGLTIAALILPHVPWRRESRLAAAASAVGLTLLIGGQVFFPPKLHVESLGDVVQNGPTPGTTDNAVPANPNDPGAAANPGGTPMPPETGWPSAGDPAIVEGKLVLNPRNHPIVGDPDAPHVVVKLFDYTCKHCRRLHGFLEEARQRYGDQLAVVVLPVPMNTDCNQFVGFTHEDHKNACHYAKLALAVWRIDRGKFEAYHHWLLESTRPPPVFDATIRAEELVGREALEQARDGAEVAQAIEYYTRLYGQLRGAIPKLILANEHVTKGEAEEAQEIFDLIEQYLGIEPVER